MGRFATGQAVRRVEDARFLRGAGRYLDDILLPDTVYGHVLRSPYGHARIDRIDTEPAKSVPGTLLIVTAEDLARDGIGPLPSQSIPKRPDGTPHPVPRRAALAEGRVRFVGEPVAFVVSETREAARAAAEAIDVAYAPLPAINDIAAALAPEAPQLHDVAPGNEAFRYEIGDEAATDEAFAKADRVVKLDLKNGRIAPTPLEPRGAIGDVDSVRDRMVLYTCSQGSHKLQEPICRDIFDQPKEKLRVVCPDVGGGFGARLFIYPEHVLVLYAAKTLKRPVKWMANRHESFLSDTHGRDHLAHAELALDADSRILALRVRTHANVGATLSQNVGWVAGPGHCRILTGAYDIPAAHARITAIYTNTPPVDAYRGAGRPEAAYLIERLMDQAAVETGLGPVEIRRQNFIPADQLPYQTVFGMTYDSGDFHATLDLGLKRADWDGFAARRADSEARGRLRGRGLAYYVEVCSGGPDERAELQFDKDGHARILIGTQTNGQGHATAYAQMAAAELGLPIEAFSLVQGDTDLVKSGRGTGGSRSVPVGGAALANAVDLTIERARPLAAAMLDAPEADIDFDTGVFRARGSNRTLRFAELQARYGARLNQSGQFRPPSGTFPNGCYVIEVEIDPDTGVVTPDRMTAVDDFGVVINPILLLGQIHGGIAQGLGQALHEEMRYAPDSAAPLTGSFESYALPRADHIPAIDHSTNNYPCQTNPLGAKGCGEAGTIGSTPAAINAVLDALRSAGVARFDMPATPERVWRALHDARAAAQTAIAASAE